MGNVLFVDAIDLSRYALTEALPFEEGETAFSRVCSRMTELPDVGQYVLLTDRPAEDFAGLWEEKQGPVVSRDSWSAAEVLREVEARRGDAGHVFYLYGDEPLLDTALAEKMFESHCSYFADYTFADGYPEGLAPDILRAESLPQLIQLAEKHELPRSRSLCFDTVEKDINAFDLETEISPVDRRMLRVVLAADTLRDTLQLKQIIAAGGRDAESVGKVLDERQELLRTRPAYVQVQICAACLQSCSYCPYPEAEGDPRGREGEMAAERWRELLEQVSEFSGEATVGISLWGEPALHSQIDELCSIAFRTPGIDLAVETSGVGWKAETLQRIARSSGSEGGAITWIVSLDALERETYRRLRGEGFEEAHAAVRMLRQLFPGQVYVQAVRMQENEEELDRFYRSWKAEEVPLIIQKYDHFCGLLPERKISDLSPIERIPCWHLKRDLAVRLDGSVDLCREDLSGAYSLGNVFEEGIKAVWEKGTSYYLRHLEGSLPDICRRCDEYYTYNF
jgi:spiro-SPASM protein